MKRALSLICCLSEASSNQIALEQQAGDRIITAVKNINNLEKEKRLIKTYLKPVVLCDKNAYF